MSANPCHCGCTEWNTYPWSEQCTNCLHVHKGRQGGGRSNSAWVRSHSPASADSTIFSSSPSPASSFSPLGNTRAPPSPSSSHSSYNSDINLLIPDLPAPPSSSPSASASSSDPFESSSPSPDSSRISTAFISEKGKSVLQGQKNSSDFILMQIKFPSTYSTTYKTFKAPRTAKVVFVLELVHKHLEKQIIPEDEKNKTYALYSTITGKFLDNNDSLSSYPEEVFTNTIEYKESNPDTPKQSEPRTRPRANSSSNVRGSLPLPTVSGTSASVIYKPRQGGQARASTENKEAAEIPPFKQLHTSYKSQYDLVVEVERLREEMLKLSDLADDRAQKITELTLQNKELTSRVAQLTARLRREEELNCRLITQLENSQTTNAIQPRMSASATELADYVETLVRSGLQGKKS